jgi:MraZ protein
MVFTGYFEHSIDEKNRLAIPAKIRSRLEAEKEGRCYVIVPGRPDNTLWIYTERQFERISESRQSTFTPSREQLRWEQFFFALAEHVEPDVQGRIVIPERMLRSSGLGREVVICGVRDHLEVRRRDEFGKALEEYRAAFNEYEGPPHPEAPER